MARARDIPNLAAATPFRDAAASVVGTRAEEVWQHEVRALDMGDIEGVHDMRVAVRRLRAVLEIFAPAFPKRRHREALADVKRLAAALGERRDPDVMIERLERIARELTNEDRPGIESLVVELRTRQEHANRQLERRLRKTRESRLRERLRLLAAEVRG